MTPLCSVHYLKNRVPTSKKPEVSQIEKRKETERMLRTPPTNRAGTKRTKYDRERSDKRSKRSVQSTVYAGLRPNRLSGPFPPIMKGQVVYCEVVYHPITSGNGSYLFSANGLFKPNITGAGRQPYYFDQLMALYNYYTVTSSSIEVQPIYLTGGGSQLCVALLQDDDGSLSAAAFSEVAERPGAKSMAVQMGSNPIPIIRGYWGAAKNFGKVYASNPDFKGNDTTNPQEQMYFGVYFSEPAGSAGTVCFRVKITYNTTCTELKTVGPS